MFRNEALQTGLGKTANDLLDLIKQHRGSEESPLVSVRNQTQSITDSATGRRLTDEKIPATTARNTQQNKLRNHSGKTHMASASGSGGPYRQTLASNSSSAEGQFAPQSERFASTDAKVSGSESKASALGLRPGPTKQFTPREGGAGLSGLASSTTEEREVIASTLAALGLDHSDARATELLIKLVTSLQSKTSSGAELARSEPLDSGAEVESQIQAFCRESSRDGGLSSSAEETMVGPANAPGTSTTVKPHT